MKKLLFAIAALVLLLVLLALAAVALGEKALVASFETFGPDLTKTPVDIDSVAISWRGSSIALRGLEVGNPVGFRSPYALRMAESRVAVAPRTLFSRKIVLEEVLMEGPEIVYELSRSGGNLSQILANVESYIGSDVASADRSGRGRAFEVRKLTLRNGSVTLAGSLFEGGGLVVDLPPIVLEDIGTGPEGASASEVVARILRAIDAEAIAAARDSAASVGSQLREAGDRVRDIWDRARSGGDTQPEED